MFGGKGYFRGGSMLVSGSAGTGKTSIAAHFVDAACRRGERCIYFAFEESPDQIVRNMRSIGIDLDRWRAAGNLRFAASRPASLGLEVHLSGMLKLVDDFKPAGRRPRSGVQFRKAGGATDALAMLMRMVDLMKIAADHCAVHQPDERRTVGRAERGRNLLADRFLADRAQPGSGRRAHPYAVDHQVARHEALQSGA